MTKHQHTHAAYAGLSADAVLSARFADGGDPSSPIEAAARATRAAFWFAASSFCTLTTAWFTACFEWEHYRRLAWSLEIEPTLWDRTLLAWLLWWKSLVLFVPVLVVCGLLAWRRRLRMAATTLLLGWVAIMFWLVADLRLQQVVGSHVFDYLPNLYDAVMMPLEADHTEWAGDPSGILLGSSAVLAGTVLIACVLWYACCWVTRRWVSRWMRLDGVLGLALPTLGFLIPLLGLLPAQACVSSSLVLRPMKAAVPVDVSVLDAWTDVTRQGLGQKSLRPRDGVRIISLLPNPAGPDTGREEVHLRNFSSKPVPLDGWRIQDGRKSTLGLEGLLPPGETRVVTLPPNTVRLHNSGDDVDLVDSAGKVVHQVSYHRQEAKYGGVINFRQAGDFEAFEIDVNARVLTSYRSMHARITSARVVDRETVVRSESPPNVIYLVLESFRHSAISPRLMSKLDAWSQGGLRCSRHYAGSNASHFGLFTLLYGRSPLAYASCLDAKVPPQTAYTLRKSGYECHFLTAGNCFGFRRMGEFLNEDFFDGIANEHGKTWCDRTQRDRRTLARVRRLATESADKPRFLLTFLMSTHFPYSFPAEFEFHRPSGSNLSHEKIGLEWKGMDRKVLHNRYKNAALFLEHEIEKLIQSLDPKRNLIVITGDHGESMSEDGALAHGSRGSEIQTRVPLVMVGPGVPARVIDAPTTHMDVLPTVLHALAGRHVGVKHTHGRDLLGGTALEDRVLLCPYRWKAPYDLILIRGQERLQLKFQLDRPTIQVIGFCDEAANLCFKRIHDVSARAAKQWAEAFRQELARIAK